MLEDRRFELANIWAKQSVFHDEITEPKPLANEARYLGLVFFYFCFSNLD